MKRVTEHKIVIRLTQHWEKPPEEREKIRGEWLARILPMAQREFPGYQVQMEYDDLYICEGCGAEWHDIETFHACASCSKEICPMCGYLSPRIGHRLWYCEEHA